MTNKATAAGRHFLLTGQPGVGKTTLIIQLLKQLEIQNRQISGFYTEEVRTSGRRTGFDVVTVDGQRGHLARISDSPEIPAQRQHRVGQYVVNLLSFEETALPALQAKFPKETHKRQIVIIDEIGKMESFSSKFVQAVHNLVSQPDVVLIATIPLPKGRPIPIVEEMRAGPNSVVFEVTHQNRDTLLNSIMTALGQFLQK